ncbi:MAG TPA: DUF3224 domain-containing protein [Pseudomonadales bacterium]
MTARSVSRTLATARLARERAGVIRAEGCGAPAADGRRGADGWLTMTVVPDSGTGGLTGLEGEMQVQIAGDEHRDVFEYTLPDRPEPR